MKYAKFKNSDEVRRIAAKYANEYWRSVSRSVGRDTLAERIKEFLLGTGVKARHAKLVSEELAYYSKAWRSRP